MKKILLSVIVIAAIAITSRVHSQCTVSNLSVEPISFNAVTCVVKFNISFEQEINSGNKFAYIHLWKSDSYHLPASEWTVAKDIYGGPSKYPEYAQLQNALATIAIEFNGTALPAIGSVYYPNPGVPPAGITPITAGLTITKTLLPGGTRERETIAGLELTLPNCAGVVTFKGDIWASQAANGKNVHCAVQGLTFNVNNPLITSAFKVCSPRGLTFSIQNNGTGDIAGFFYRIYKDDGDGIFEPSTGAGLDGPPIITSTAATLVAGNSRSEVQLPFPGSDIYGENSSYWLEAVDPSVLFTTVAFMSNEEAGCLVLPVSFKSFTAARNRSNVGLKWETTTELNNLGFTVQRNIAGIWQDIAFVPSQAAGGNSDALLTYTLNDLNPTKGITQYRLKQVDLDGKSKLSEIRAVRGEGQLGKTIVYPNPSNTGNVNIVFEDANVKRDVSVIDMSGKIIKQWRNVSNNNLQLENLPSGVFSVRILAVETGEQVVEKIIVNKR